MVRQARDSGLAQPVVAAGSVYSPKFLELGGAAADGVYTNTNFFPDDPRPVVQRFVAAFRASMATEPGLLQRPRLRRDGAVATADAAVRRRPEAMHDGLRPVRDVPSVLFGTVTFDPETRRVAGPS